MPKVGCWSISIDRSSKKEIRKVPSLSDKWKIYGKLQSPPRNSAPTRLRRRCFSTGRPRANYRDFGLSGYILREMVHACLLPGATRSILVTNYLQLHNLKQTVQYSVMDENGKIWTPSPGTNIILNPFNLNWYFLHYNYCEETSTIMSLGQFISENICIAKNGPHLKSGQVLIVQVDSIVIRSILKTIMLSNKHA